MTVHYNNSEMLLWFKYLLLALTLNLVDSNYEIANFDSIENSESCIEPEEATPESNCYCYNKPENDFEYTICKEPSVAGQSHYI